MVAVESPLTSIVNCRYDENACQFYRGVPLSSAVAQTRKKMWRCIKNRTIASKPQTELKWKRIMWFTNLEDQIFCGNPLWRKNFALSVYLRNFSQHIIHRVFFFRAENLSRNCNWRPISRVVSFTLRKFVSFPMLTTLPSKQRI